MPKDGYKKLLGKQEWLYDTGASYRMTRMYNVLEDVRSIDRIMVGLLDDNQAAAKKMGTMDLGPNLKSKDVLFVSKLKFNWTSIY